MQETSDLWEVRAGRVDYRTADEWQRNLHSRRITGEVSDVLLLLEHNHVYTLGRRFRPEHLLTDVDRLRQRGIEVFECDRGGSITYHGPGQLVAYPVIDLRESGRAHPDVMKYLRMLEAAIVGVAEALGVEAGTRPGLTGVWVEDRKLAAIGINVSRGVSKHGLAINVSTDLDYFRWMVPCGIEGGGVTSLEELLGAEVPMEEVATLVAQSLASLLGRRRVQMPLSTLFAPQVPEPVLRSDMALRDSRVLHG